MPLVAIMTILILLMISLAGCTSAEGSILTQNLSEPLGDATSATIEIDPGDGSLTIDQLVSSEQELVSGTLQYPENQGQPIHTIDTNGGRTTLTLKASRGQQPWIRLPWEACSAATEWQIHLNPSVTSDITAHTDGGNVTLNLVSMAITNLLADTGGGNMEVILPQKTANLSATVKTGGGNVTVEVGSGITGSNTVHASTGAGNVAVTLPDGIAARIHASSGMGKIMVGSQFSKVDDTTYQTPDYASAADTVDITVSSGAGDVTIETN